MYLCKIQNAITDRDACMYSQEHYRFLNIKLSALNVEQDQ